MQISRPARRVLATNILKTLGALVLSGTGLAVMAQSSYPSRPVTLVVPFQAGGGADAVARAVAEAASKELGQAIVVENKPGADAQLGTLDVAKAAPDGYRILLGGAGGLLFVPALRKTPPYDPVKDFTPVAGVSEFSFFLYVNSKMPVKTLAEYVAYVKANPGKVSHATGNNQGIMSMAYLNRDAGMETVQVQYRGEPAAVLDLVSGQVQSMFATTVPMPHVKTGQLRVLATTLAKRSKVYPDVPTMKEAGQKDLIFGGGWVAVFGPAGLPKDVTDKLGKAFSAAVAKPEVQARMQQLGLEPMPMNSQELADYTKAQAVVYRDAVRELKMGGQ